MSAVTQSKLVIIGSGPAGYTAAIYAARAMLEPILIQGIQPGGQLTITTDVENYPGFADVIQGPWLMEQMQKQAEHVGTKIVTDHVNDLDLSQRPFKLTTDSGDIYIADTLNYRVRMIDAKTGLIHTVAGDGSPGEDQNVGDGGAATRAHLNMPSDVALETRNGALIAFYVADMHHNRVRRVDVKTGIITTVAGSGKWGFTGDDGPATQATLAGPAGVAVVPEPAGKVTVFIADYYNGHVRAVGPDGIIRDLSDEGREAFGAPTRLAYDPRRGFLYVADSSQDRVVPLIIPKIAPNLVPPRPLLPPRRVGG